MKNEKRKEDILEYIESYTADNCTSPSVREIQAKLGIKSTATVFEDLQALADEGRIAKIGTKFAPVYSKSYVDKVRRHLQ